MVRNFIFLGAPGVGKGTLAKQMAKDKGIIHISTGDIFRRNIKEGTPLGKKVKSILDAGEYVPDSLTNSIVEDTLEREDVKKAGFILDGYPRTLNQAEFIKSEGIDITAVVLLQAPDELIRKRLLQRTQKEKRTDDSPEIIKNRIKVYRERTAPLIDWYTDEKLIVKIDVSGDVAENVENIESALY